MAIPIPVISKPTESPQRRSLEALNSEIQTLVLKSKDQPHERVFYIVCLYVCLFVCLFVFLATHLFIYLFFYYFHYILVSWAPKTMDFNFTIIITYYYCHSYYRNYKFIIYLSVLTIVMSLL